MVRFCIKEKFSPNILSRIIKEKCKHCIIDLLYKYMKWTVQVGLEFQ